ncbi:unnamed protein product [Effrenium voratum]|nr:unnamed protein product [Effrenium voratum]
MFRAVSKAAVALAASALCFSAALPRRWAANGPARLNFRGHLKEGWRTRLRVRPYYGDGELLSPGEIVGYRLDLPGGFVHTGIHLGPGGANLSSCCGADCLDGHHYVIEFSGPTRTSGFPQSSVAGRVSSGLGSQNIWITAMEPETEWLSFELLSEELGPPFSGEETVKRALSKVSTPFGGYDVVRNNCQHFAVWAKYGKRRMMLADEGKITLARQVGAAGLGLLPPPWRAISWFAGLLNLASADFSGTQFGSRIQFQ